MQRIIDHFGLLSFIDAAKALMTCPHYMMAHPEEGYIGTYFYIVMNGIQDFVPFIWRSGDPPRRMTVEQLPHDMVTQDMPGLYNRRLQKPTGASTCRLRGVTRVRAATRAITCPC